MARKPVKSNDTTANVGFEAKLWAAADAHSPYPNFRRFWRGVGRLKAEPAGELAGELVAGPVGELAAAA